MNSRLIEVIAREASAIQDSADADAALLAIIACCACCNDDPAADAVSKLAGRLLETLDDMRADLEEVTAELDELREYER